MTRALQNKFLEDLCEPVLVWEWNGVISLWNQAAVRLYGFSRDEALGRVSHQLLQTQWSGSGFLDALERQRCWSGELVHTTKSGDSLTIETRMSLVEESGRVYVVESNRDITERKRRELSQQEREYWFNFALELSSLGVVVFDEHQRYQYANQQYKKILGIPPSLDLVGKTFVEVLGAPYENSAKQIFERVIGGESLRYEFSPVGASGSYYSLLCEPVDAPAGRVVMMTALDITERKKAEIAQREGEAWFRTVTDSARVGMVIVDEEHRYRYANRAYAKILRLPSHHIVGQRVADVLAPVYASQIKPRLDRAFRGERVNYELAVPGHGDEVRYYTVTYEPNIDHNDRSVIVVLVEISTQKRVENALRISEESLRLLMEGVHGYTITMLDPQGRILTWSQEAERINGYSAEEALGREYSFLFTPEEVAVGKPRLELEKATREGRAEIEGWRMRKSGAHFWVNGTLSALHASDGTVRGFAKITRDLTTKRHNDELLLSVLNHTIDGIISIDEHGTISLFNQAAERLFGYKAGDVLGKNISLLMPEPDHSQHDGYIHHYLQTGEAKVIGLGREVVGLRSNGSTFPMALAVTEFHLDQQRHFVGIVRDLSNTKLLEQQLRQSQKLEAIGQLAGGIAHDFNNLLTIISANSEALLMTDTISDEDKMLAEDILHAGDRAAAMTRQLLAFSRRQILEPKVIDPNTIISEVEKMLRRLLGENVLLTTTLRPLRNKVKVDPGQLEQVIINLAINARDAMPRGGQLSIETSEIDAAHTEKRAGRFVLIKIIDTGEGMTPDVRARIFEPFFTTKGVGKGTGLGLAVAHGIVSQSGGTIEVDSEPNRGTTVKVFLPATQQEVSPSLPTNTPNDFRGDETILLVEDEDSVREVAAVGLQRLSYKVLKAKGGQEALQLLLQHPKKIDILVTDVVMPEMSGRELAERLNALRPEIKLLFVSGYNDEAISQSSLLSGASFLQKPFTPLSLARKVREVLDTKGAQRGGS